MDLLLATLKQSLSICCTMFQHIYEISSLRVNIIKWQVKFNPVA